MPGVIPVVRISSSQRSSPAGLSQPLAATRRDSSTACSALVAELPLALAAQLVHILHCQALQRSGRGILSLLLQATFPCYLIVVHACNADLRLQHDSVMHIACNGAFQQTAHLQMQASSMHCQLKDGRWSALGLPDA